MARHFEDDHSKETEITEALMYAKWSKERRILFESITRRGDYVNNMKVLQLGKENLILSRKPTTEELEMRSYEDYTSGSGCFGFVVKAEL